MLQLRQRLRVVVDAEVDDVLDLTAQVGDQRVVCVQREARLRRVMGDGVGPALGQQLELAVAVELVAEQVREHDEARLGRVGHGRQPRLVDLEQPELAVLTPGVQQRGRDAPVHVGARAVVHDGNARLGEDRREHRSRGGLPVGGGDQDRAALQLARQLLDGIRLQPQQDASRCRGAALAGPARDRARGPGQSQRRREHQEPFGTRTRSGRGDTRTVAGSSPIGSPSA